MGAPQVLAGVWKLEASTEREPTVKLHPTLERCWLVWSHLVIQAVLILYLLRDQCVVSATLWFVPHAFPLIGLEKLC